MRWNSKVCKRGDFYLGVVIATSTFCSRFWGATSAPSVVRYLVDDDKSTPDFATGTLDATSTHPSGSFRKLSYGFAIPKRDLRFSEKRSSLQHFLTSYCLV